MTMSEHKLKTKYIPTCNLRVLEKNYGDRQEKVLQQEFISTVDGKSEWRSIPVVVQNIKGSEF